MTRDVLKNTKKGLGLGAALGGGIGAIGGAVESNLLASGAMNLLGLNKTSALKKLLLHSAVSTGGALGGGVAGGLKGAALGGAGGGILDIIRALQKE